MTIKTVNVQFAVNDGEEFMAVVRDVNTYELLSVKGGKDVSDLYYNLTRRDMRNDWDELRAVRPSEESST